MRRQVETFGWKNFKFKISSYFIFYNLSLDIESRQFVSHRHFCITRSQTAVVLNIWYRESEVTHDRKFSSMKYEVLIRKSQFLYDLQTKMTQ